MKSQIATSRDNKLFEGQEGGRRKLPYAFTEQGIYMLVTVLRGELAEQQSIFIMCARLNSVLGENLVEKVEFRISHYEYEQARDALLILFFIAFENKKYIKARENHI